MIASPNLPPQQAIMVEARANQKDVEGCSPVPGFSSGDIDDDAKYLLFGQSYGTNEFVREFGNVVCDLSKTRPLTVGIEWPTEDTEAFASYISDPHPDADKALMALAIWDKDSTDGRSSQAMFELMRLLRRLHLAGRDIKIAAFVPPISGDQNAWEAGIANQLESIAGHERLVIALMGNVQATKKQIPDPRFEFYLRTIDPAADRLPSEQVISIHFESKGGTGFGLNGPYELPAYGGGSTLWSRYASTINGYDGRLYVGAPTTASLPERR